MKQTMTSVVGAVFLVLLAPILATQVAAYAAQTDANDTLVTVFNLMVWGIPLGLAAALILAAFVFKKGG